MAKTSGDTRVSRWRDANAPLSSDLYYHDGRRVEYEELSNTEKNAVKREKTAISKALYAKLKDTTTPQVIDNGKRIEIAYTSKGLDHFANDAMLNLSGKYFGRDSMMRVNEILEKSTYLPTPHGLTHPRTDGRSLWFSYKDADGRGVYFKVTYNSQLSKYELYSVVDKI